MKTKDIRIPGDINVTINDERPIAEFYWHQLKNALNWELVFRSKKKRKRAKKIAREMRGVGFEGTVGEFLEQRDNLVLPKEIFYFEEETQVSWRMTTLSCTLDALKEALSCGLSSGGLRVTSVIHRLVTKMEAAGHTGTVESFIRSRPEVWT